MVRSQQDAPSAALLGRLGRSARRAVETVAAYVVGQSRPSPRADVTRKGAGDFVTAVDVAAEARLRELLLGEYPEHGFLGEESEPVRLDAPLVWCVDPIDGTSNFAQGLPQYGVSAACLHRGTAVAAAVHVMPEGVTYSAIAGRGARRGSRPLRVPEARLDDAAVLGVQWFRGTFEPAWLGPLFEAGGRIRVLGSTVVQICDVAAGRLHANVQSQGMPWDWAGAALVAIEAGCRVTDWDGRSVFPVRDLAAPEHVPTIVATRAVHRRLWELVRGRAHGR
ncbi:MAG: inositol monophosphatase [Planctomycetes bacterium]|nr:inositol monophosphatase [Planctomycetota bacterium]